jgi:hypothetical protein
MTEAHPRPERPPERDVGPELSSMAATLEDLARRVTAMAEESSRRPGDNVGGGGRRAVSISQELFEVERSLAEAVRRLGALSRAVRRANP